MTTAQATAHVSNLSWSVQALKYHQPLIFTAVAPLLATDIPLLRGHFSVTPR